MKKQLLSLLLLLCLSIWSSPLFAQNFTMLVVDDFEPGGPNTVFPALNNGGGSGTNEWIVNGEFDGLGVYPNTPTQTITSGGIGEIGTPDGTYLHILDNGSAASNSNFDPSIASDRWAIMNTDYCTYGYARVVFNFWWHAEGSPTDYGEVYYSIDAGATWTLTTNDAGMTAYSNASAWVYSSIEDPIFLDQQTLRFAFKWTNDGVNTSDAHPFSIDDIMLIAYWDDISVACPIAISFPTNLCHEDPSPLSGILIDFPEPFCVPTTYMIELSDGNCDWANSTIFAYFEIDGSEPWFTPGWNGMLNLSGVLPFNTNLPFGNCYCFRVNRVTPPVCIGESSTQCIAVVDCEDSTVTDQPAVTMDPLYDINNPANPPGMPSGQQPVCIYSKIDVPFYSYGGFNPGNNYILELSDEFGSFANPTVIGGPTPDTRTYDPALPYLPPPPGSMSGQIPVVPPGCNYYVRVVATDPVVNSVPPAPQHATPWGPFCIKECDILTNNMEDISVCVTNTDSACVTLIIDINSFDPSIFYNNGNEFLVQILSMGPPPYPQMWIINETYWTYDGTQSDTVELCVPILPELGNIPLALGTYYMRIVATNSSDPTNVLGSVIHFSIGGVSGDPFGVLITPDSIFCGDQTIINMFVMPQTYPPGSKWAWFIDGFQINWDQPSLSLNAANWASGVYEVTVQEVSPNGDPLCVGPMSGPSYFYIDVFPPVTIFGPPEVCEGDTSTYTIDYDPNTYYEWSLTNADNIGTVLYQANNQITIVWTQQGTPSVNIFACNICDNEVSGCSQNSLPVLVKPKAVINASNDTTICEGETLHLFAQNIAWPIQNTFSWVDDPDTVQQHYYDMGNKDTLVITPSESVTYYLLVDHGCPNYDTIVVTVVEDPEVNATNAAICLGDTTQLNALTDNANNYLWVPASSLSNAAIPDPIAFPDTTTNYVVTVSYDPVNNVQCPDQSDTLQVEVYVIAVEAGDNVQIYTGDQVMLGATGGVTYSWSPDYALSDPTSANPIASPLVTTTYYVTITDQYGCVDIDSMTVEVLSAGFQPSVPDAFYPGSQNDGNDKLYVFDLLAIEKGFKHGEAVETILFKIYNRWGELIYEADDKTEIIYENGGGWDGTHMNTGKEMEVGVYVWVLEATTVRGDVIGPLNGNVTLLK